MSAVRFYPSAPVTSRTCKTSKSPVFVFNLYLSPLYLTFFNLTNVQNFPLLKKRKLLNLDLKARRGSIPGVPPDDLLEQDDIFTFSGTHIFLIFFTRARRCILYFSWPFSDNYALFQVHFLISMCTSKAFSYREKQLKSRWQISSMHYFIFKDKY